jgi:hypothetical protein
MAKEKLTLDELKVQSFTTALSKEQMTEVKGGIYIIKGRKFDYRVRWTSLDTRAEEPSTIDNRK